MIRVTYFALNWSQCGGESILCSPLVAYSIALDEFPSSIKMSLLHKKRENAFLSLRAHGGNFPCSSIDYFTPLNQFRSADRLTLERNFFSRRICKSNIQAL